MISCILATYNRAHLLPRAINSVLAQTTEDWELVIVDDGSTDDTRAILATYLSDPRIHYFNQPNAGLAHARNAGVQHARRALVTFLDSDDQYTPDHLALRLAEFAAHPETDLLHGGVQIVGGPDYVPDVNDPTRRIMLTDCFIGGTFVLRRSVYLALGGFQPPDFGTDYDLAQRAMPHYTIRKIDAPTYIYHRDTADSICNLVEKSCG